jgi:DNA-dependent RNA polymerase auxiliary subunit epsilon
MMRLTNEIIKAAEPSPELRRLNESEISIVKAQSGRRISEMSNSEINKLAGEIIFLAKSRLGHNHNSGEELVAEIKLISCDLRGFKGLTSTEIHLALKSGLDGDFSNDGKVFFSSSNFVNWVKRWIDEKKRPVIKHVTLVEQSKETTKPPPTDEEYKALTIQIANNYREALLKDKDFVVEFASTLYDDLVKFEIWEMPLEEKRILFEEIELKYKGASRGEQIIKAKNIAYNRFIALLVTQNKRLDDDGKIENNGLSN